MRMAARTSSATDAARADFPSIGARIDDWSERLARVDWTPWLIIALGAFLRLFLLAIKPPHFDEGINVTLGLPIVRTSPDHGTAFDIAGKNMADPGAMIAAIRTAGDCVARLAAA